ncbi:MAG: hypothetical protein NXI32_26735 [bacterium]|nr:hypothetical protein [bacterium]
MQRILLGWALTGAALCTGCASVSQRTCKHHKCGHVPSHCSRNACCGSVHEPAASEVAFPGDSTHQPNPPTFEEFQSSTDNALREPVHSKGMKLRFTDTDSASIETPIAEPTSSSEAVEFGFAESLESGLNIAVSPEMEASQDPSNSQLDDGLLRLSYQRVIAPIPSTETEPAPSMEDGSAFREMLNRHGVFEAL